MAGTRRRARGRTGVEDYVPPDPTRVDLQDSRALDFWSRTLEVPPERIREAVGKAGSALEEVKRELGIAGV